MHFLDPRDNPQRDLWMRSRSAMFLRALAGAVEGLGTRDWASGGTGKFFGVAALRFAGFLRARAYVLTEPNDCVVAQLAERPACGSAPDAVPLREVAGSNPPHALPTARDLASPGFDPTPTYALGGPLGTTLVPTAADPSCTANPQPADADALPCAAGASGVVSRGRTLTLAAASEGLGTRDQALGAIPAPHSPPHCCEVRVDPGAEGSPPPPATPVAPTHGWLSPAQIAAHHAGEFCGVAGCSSCEFCRAVCADIGITPTRRLGWRTAPDTAKVG